MTTDAAPWYRHRWPWLLIAGPAIVVCASVATLWLAASTDDGVIADDYYKRGLVINRELEREARAAAMGVAGVLEVAPDGAARLELDDLGERAPATVRVLLAHPTRAGQDRSVVLTRGPGGAYVGTIAPLPEGPVLVTVEGDGWRLPTVRDGGRLAEVRVGAVRPRR